MTTSFLKVNVNIDEHPEATPLPEDVTEITRGDLHAHAPNLLHLLIYHGICKLPKDDYECLIALSKVSAENITLDELKEFEKLIDKMEIANPDVLLRLIGDEVADRGMNDWYILLLLKKLPKAEILFSNHGAEFVEAYERFHEREDKLTPTVLFGSQSKSLKGLSTLIERNLISIEAVKEIINDFYKPKLKLLSYSLEKDGSGISIFTHAAVGLETIKALTLKFNLPYTDDTATKLAETIDKINSCFAKYVIENRVHELYSTTLIKEIGKPDFRIRDLSHRNAILKKCPIEFITWNRQTFITFNRQAEEILVRPKVYKGFKIDFSHGHDIEEIKPEDSHLHSLDGKLGKATATFTGIDFNSQDDYLAVTSTGVQLTNHAEVYKALKEAPSRDLPPPAASAPVESSQGARGFTAFNFMHFNSAVESARTTEVEAECHEDKIRNESPFDSRR